MDYSKTYLGKSLGELTHADVADFFLNEREETDQIEFKSYNERANDDDRYKGLVGSIAAFLNSGGGLLIWGAPNGITAPGKREKIFKGPLTKVPLTIEKDWLISKIVDKIIPLPIGIRVKLLIASDSQIAVFEVDESIYSPHQTSHVYLMRVDGQTKPAPHHYVEALFKKISFPRLEGYICPGAAESDSNGFLVKIEFIIINFSPFLNEESLYYRIAILSGIFNGQKGSPGYRAGSIHGMATDVFDKGVNGNKLRSTSNTALFYGEPHRIKREIFFYGPRLKLNDYKGKVVLLFGGKSAPMKCCQYTIDFKEMDSRATTFTVDYQNKFMSQIQQENEHSETDILNQLNVLT